MMVPPLCYSLYGCLKSSGDLSMAQAHCSRQDGQSQSLKDPPMAYSIYLDHYMQCRHHIIRVRDLGVYKTSGHRVIPRWISHIASLWERIHIIEASPNDLVLFPSSFYGM